MTKVTCVLSYVVKDMAPPNIPKNGQILSGSQNKILLKWEDNGDNGTSYKHYAESYNSETNEKLSTSNTIDFYKISGIQGYYYYIDTNENGTATKNNTFINKNSLEVDYVSYNRYMHVAAVDYAGNLGLTYTFRIPVGIVINFNKNDTIKNINGDNITTKASGTMQSQLIQYGASANLNKNNFVKEGYTFTSWNTKSDGTGESFENAQSVSYESLFRKYGASLTLYAQFKPNKYFVKYEKGLSDTTIKGPNNSAHFFDSAVTLSKNTFIGKSYKLSFDGNLPLKYDGNVTNSKAENMPNSIEGVLDFDKYKVTSTNNSGFYADNTNLGVKNFENKEAAVATATATYKTKTVTFKNPSLTGYNFVGWFTKKTDGNMYEKTAQTSIANIAPSTAAQNDTLYAHWTAHTYKVIYKNYDGHGNDYTQNCTYDKLYYYLNNPSDLSDSIFLGWFNKENPSSLTDGIISGGTSFTNLTSTDNGIIYVYGKWSKTKLKEDIISGNPVFIKAARRRPRLQKSLDFKSGKNSDFSGFFCCFFIRKMA